MWSKITLRKRITLLTMLALSLVTASLTLLSNHNAQRHFVTPLERFEGSLGVNIIDFQIDPRYEDLLEEAAMPVAPVIITTHDEAATQVQFLLLQSNDDFQTYSILIAIVFILIGTLIAYIISGQALKPVKSLVERIEDVDVNNLGTLIEPPRSDDEISRLTHSFNNMLTKLNRSFENQKLFAQNAAHELKTPLASIMTNIEVLQLDDEPSIEEYKEVVDTVKASTKQLIELVQGLLSINSIIDESKWQSFNARGVFEEIISVLREDITQRGLDVSIIGDCRLKGDKSLLGRAFSNLVHNAVRYNIDKGNVNISLSEEHIVIEDSGVGIPAEDLEHIFEPFYVVDKSRTKDLGGHGLGMAIAKSIFDKHHMKICISSEPGKGTKIFLSKPKI